MAERERKPLPRKRLVFLIINAVLLLAALVCFAAALLLPRRLSSQQAAMRWQGESGERFSQVSCYIPVDEKITLDQAYRFRSDAMTRLSGASLELDGELRLYVDAWCTTGKLKAVTALGNTDAAVIAVGGDFFQFHPLRLLSGSYIAEGDLMQDRVLLDEDLAWLLFGGTDLEGMTIDLNGNPFLVAGVVERERDFASRKAYTAGMGLYMSYDAYAAMTEGAGINCYELVMAEPVKGFAVNLVREKFPIGHGEILENSTRFTVGRLLGLIGKFGSRSMQTLGVVYPYWENAARCVEDWCSMLLTLGMLLVALPLATAVLYLVRLLARGKEKLEDDWLPAAKDRAEEAVRVRQRRRWEKKHGLHEKR